MREVAEQDLVLYGKITKRHGVRGEVKMVAFGGRPGTVSGAESILVEIPGLSEPRSFRVRGVKIRKNAAVLKLDGIDTPEAASGLAGLNVLVPRDDLEPPGEDEYWWSDLIGLRVRTSGGEDIGEVTGLMGSAGQDVLVIRSPDGGRELLVPFVGKFVTSVDIGGSVITVEPAEGLFE